MRLDDAIEGTLSDIEVRPTHSASTSAACPHWIAAMFYTLLDY
ncbi:MAG: hypothetical protein QOD92_2089 [Acidimicrobiaceae bacterium]|jgi:hypothetical protein